MSDIEYRYLLNRCLRADFSKYNREYGYLAHLYATDINAYNDAVMQLANGSAVVTMELHKRYKGSHFALVFF